MLLHIPLFLIKYLISQKKMCGLASWPQNSLLSPWAPLLEKQLASQNVEVAY